MKKTELRLVEFQSTTEKKRKETKNLSSRLASPDSVDASLAFWAKSTEVPVLQEAISNVINSLNDVKWYFTRREFDVLNLSILKGWSVGETSRALKLSIRRVSHIRQNAKRKFQTLIIEESGRLDGTI